MFFYLKILQYDFSKEKAAIAQAEEEQLIQLRVKQQEEIQLKVKQFFLITFS